MKNGTPPLGECLHAAVPQPQFGSWTSQLQFGYCCRTLELAYSDRASNRAIEAHSDNEEFLGQIFKNAETKAIFTKVFAKSLYKAIRDELDIAG